MCLPDTEITSVHLHLLLLTWVLGLTLESSGLLPTPVLLDCYRNKASTFGKVQDLGYSAYYC